MSAEREETEEEIMKEIEQLKRENEEIDRQLALQAQTPAQAQTNGAPALTPNMTSEQFRKEAEQLHKEFVALQAMYPRPN